jgi:hypothetical protein
VRRSTLGWTAAALVTAFLIVLAVPREQRGLALYAFLLFVGALALAGLVALIAVAPAGEDRLLEAVPPEPERRPGELEALEHDVREALSTGAVEDRLRSQFRSIAAVRLARAHTVPPSPSGDSALARLLAPLEPGRMRIRLRPGELARAVEELERL